MGMGMDVPQAMARVACSRLGGKWRVEGRREAGKVEAAGGMEVEVEESAELTPA